MAIHAEIFEARQPLRGGFVASLALHGTLAACALLLPAILGNLRGNTWGGSENGAGDAMSATLVSSIPLPANPEGKNVLAVESQGLSQSEPKPEEKAPDAIPIPDSHSKIREQRHPATPVKPPPRQMAALEDNRIPFGEGGPISGPYGSFNAGSAKGGLGFTGGAGDFGSRYSWYVDIVRRKVQENWLKYEVDRNASTTQRTYIYFEILRSGAPANIRIEQSSGIPSLDQSALRALQRIDTFGPLPGDYSGSKVSVEFWFDLRR